MTKLEIAENRGKIMNKNLFECVSCKRYFLKHELTSKFIKLCKDCELQNLSVELKNAYESYEKLAKEHSNFADDNARLLGQLERAENVLHKIIGMGGSLVFAGDIAKRYFTNKKNNR